MSGDKQVGYTRAKRRNTDTLRMLKNEIEAGVHMDPVLRLAKDQAKDGSNQGKSKQPNLETAYSSMHVLQPPFSMPVMIKLPDLDPYLSGALEAIATNVSACNLDLVYSPVGDEEPPASELEALTDFFFTSNDPTHPASLHEKIESATMDYLCLGSWNLELVQFDKRFTDMLHMPAEYVRVKDSLDGYKMIKNSQTVEFDMYGVPVVDNQVLRCIRKRPGHRVYGKPIHYSLANTVLINSLRDEKNLNWFRGGALSDIFLTIEEGIDPDMKERIIADYMDTGDGESALYIIDAVGNSSLSHIKREIEGVSMDRMEENNRQRVYTALRVPPAKVATYEDANRANTITQDEVFQNEVIQPIQQTYMTRFDHIIRYHFEFERWNFQFTPMALKDQKIEAEVLTRYMEFGVYGINDVLKILGEKPVAGGERRIIFAPQGLIDVETGEDILSVNGSYEAQERLAAAKAMTAVTKLREVIKKRVHDDAGCQS